MNDVSRQVVRFRDFELDHSAHELRRRGKPTPLEGHALALLILLLERPGALVTRDEIIARLWGSDAFVDVESGINTAVHKLRMALGDRAATPRFVKTVQGRGYRFIAPLAEAASPAPPSVATESPSPAPARRRSGGWIRFGLVATAALGLVLLIVALAPQPLARPQVQVTAFRALTADAPSRALADLIGDEITGVMNETGVQTSPPPWWTWPSLRRPAPRFVLGGAAGRDGGSLRARVYMADARSGLTLWTREFTGSPGEESALAASAAGAAAEVMGLALEPLAQKYYTLEPEALAFHIRGGVLFRSPPALNQGGIRRAYEQLVARAPGFALGHGELALILAMESGRLAPAERVAAQARAEAEARRAIRIDPAAAGYAYGALGILAYLRDPTDLEAIERPYRDGLALQPDFGPFSMRLCDVLTDVGRNAEALRFCERAVALRPMATPNAWKYAEALDAAGDHDRALQQVAKAARYDFESNDVRLVRLLIAIYGDEPAAARAVLEDPRIAPRLPRGLVDLIGLFLRARETHAASDVQAASDRIEDAVARRRLDPGAAVQMLTLLGKTDRAMAVLERGAIPPRDILAPTLKPLRGDPRFWAAADRAGLVRYWRSTRTRPDFCRPSTAPEPCATLLATGPAGGG